MELLQGDRSDLIDQTLVEKRCFFRDFFTFAFTNVTIFVKQ